MFVFAGRKPNLELQIPMVQRILEEHPHTEYHIWNFAREDDDRAYIESITESLSSPQLKVFNDSGPSAHMDAWRAYAQPAYRDCLFVKMDDDIVFLETARFDAFVAAIDAHRGQVMSANIINNGASTPLVPGIWEQFTEDFKVAKGMHLLDIHLSSDFPDMAHTYFFDHPDEVLNQPVELVPTEDWLSINMIGYDWPTHCLGLKTMGSPHPAILAGRPMKGWGGWEGPGRPYGVMGCEGSFNTMPRIIVKGFTAAHVSYGPQTPSDKQMSTWMKRYAELNQEYLNSEHDAWDGELPELSEPSCGQGEPPVVSEIGENNGAMVLIGRWGPNNWRTRHLGENDPAAGRYTP